MSLSRDSAVLGLDVRSDGSPTALPVSCHADILFHYVDANPNFVNSAIFNDSLTSGFGGWGDPNNDYQITTGALADNFEVAYPIPHRLRRNYTARRANPDPFGDGTPSPTDDLWQYFTPNGREALVQGHIGNFEGFQTQLESLFVSRSSIDDHNRRVLGCWSYRC